MSKSDNLAYQNSDETSFQKAFAIPDIYSDIKSDRIPDTNIIYYGDRPSVIGGTPLQRSLGHAESILLSDVKGKFEISYNFLTSNAEVKIFSNALVKGDLKILSERVGAVCGRLDLYILQPTLSFELLERGSKGLASKTIVVSKEQKLPLQIIMEEGANTPHYFTLDINGTNAGEHELKSSHLLNIEDSVINGVRTIRLSR